MAESPRNSPPRALSEERSSDDEMMEQKAEYKTQFLAALICCIAPICGGMTVAWTSSAVPDMKLPGRDFAGMTTSQEALVSGLTPAGALCGGLIAGMAVDYLGRRSCLIFTGVFYVIGWMAIMFAKVVPVIYFGRFITGACFGVNCLNASVYLTEIASPQIRGILGAGFQLFVNFGVLLSYFIGAFVPWSFLAVASSVLPIVNMALMIPMPETPIWLVRQERLKEALEALTWLRGPNYDSSAEISDIQRQQTSKSAMSAKEFLKPNLLKPFLLMEGQMFFQQFTGINAVIFNAKDIFDTAGSSIDSNLQAVILGIVMVVSSIVAANFMDRAGRRPLLLISGTSMAVSMIILGGFYFLLSSNKSSAEGVSWLPMVCLIVFMFVFNIGFGPVPWLMMSELFPSQARGLASSLITASNWTMAFIVTMTFRSMQELLQPYGAFWLFGFFGVLSVVFVWFLIPETKGKSLEEIEEFFSTNN